jgi:DNA polymerase V
MRVSGWSVRDAGIYDADLVIVDRALRPKNGSFVIAIHDGGFIIRQLCLTGGPPRLEHRNTGITGAAIELDETVELWGVVEAIARKLS